MTLTTTYLFPPPPVASVPVRGLSAHFPVQRLFFVGRNYHAHAVEMGRPVDKSKSRPFYFTKSATTLLPSGATAAYPPGTADYQHEMELVVAIGAPGFRVSEQDVSRLIYGYACGLDMTRRDLQLTAREQGRPWDLGKDFEQSSVISEIVQASGAPLARGAIDLRVNGQVRQQADLSQLIWSVAEILADLSSYYHLLPGDLIYTGTPDGVSAVLPGDRLEGHIEGVGGIELSIGASDSAS